MSTIEDKVRQIVVSTCKTELHNWEQRNGKRLDALEQQIQHLMEEPDPNWERLLARIEKLEKRLDLSESSTAMVDADEPDTGVQTDGRLP